MSKSWCSIKEIEVCLLCEILITEDTPMPTKLLRASLTNRKKYKLELKLIITSDRSQTFEVFYRVRYITKRCQQNMKYEV